MLVRQSSRVSFDPSTGSGCAVLRLSGLLPESKSQHPLMLSLSKHARSI